MTKEYCPDCVELLVPDHKKLGGRSCWKICPKCGLRVKTSYNDFTARAVNIENFVEKRKGINNNNYFKDIDK